MRVAGFCVFFLSHSKIFRDPALHWSLHTSLFLHTQLRAVCPTESFIQSSLCFRKPGNFLSLCGCELKAYILNLVAVSHSITNTHGEIYGEKYNKHRGRRAVDSCSPLWTGGWSPLTTCWWAGSHQVPFNARIPSNFWDGASSVDEGHKVICIMVLAQHWVLDPQGPFQFYGPHVFITEFCISERNS